MTTRAYQCQYRCCVRGPFGHLTPVFDTANAEYIVLLDASGDETVRPVEVKEFQKVRENGGYVMAVDPRNAGRRYARR